MKPPRMEWYYALNDEQHGPVTEARLDDLVREGIVTSDTPVWHNKLEEWAPLSAVRKAERAAAAAMPVLPTTRCVECGDIFTQADTVLLHNFSVCLKCRPKFQQRIRQGGFVPASLGMMWRKDALVVVGRDTFFPERCVRCNALTDGRKFKRDLWWHPSPYYALAIIPPLYVLIALIVRKQAKLYIALCEEHRATKRRTNFIATMAAISGLVLLFLAAYIENGWMALAGLFLLAGAGIYSALQASIITATKIDDRHIWFKGAGKPFLDTLPEWEEQK